MIHRYITERRAAKAFSEPQVLEYQDLVQKVAHVLLVKECKVRPDYGPKRYQ